MLQVNKDVSLKQDINNPIKLVIKTAKELLITPELTPKKVKQLEQYIKPEEAQNADSLFEIY